MKKAIAAVLVLFVVVMGLRPILNPEIRAKTEFLPTYPFEKKGDLNDFISDQEKIIKNYQKRTDLTQKQKSQYIEAAHDRRNWALEYYRTGMNPDLARELSK